MRLESLPGGACHLTYCTNIHAGESWPDIRASLRAFLPEIKRRVSPDRAMGVGLRLSGIAADALAGPDTLDELAAFLERERLYLFTVNAFPYGPFHGTRVKEEVYQPDWTTPERLRFTNLAADILAALLPDGMEGSVSTVPGTFKPLAAAPGAVEGIAERMVRHCAHLVALERRTGKRVALAVEPEPCCLIETVAETVRFWEDHLLAPPARRLLGELSGLGEAAAEAALRRHLGVCYDVCHAAVEFEEPGAGIAVLERAGIRIAKLQLSSALKVPLPHRDDTRLPSSRPSPPRSRWRFTHVFTVWRWTPTSWAAWPWLRPCRSIRNKARRRSSSCVARPMPRKSRASIPALYHQHRTLSGISAGD